MNVKSLVKNKKGFTIIEVVLVLAIAGLIFLMVFLALPAMQKSQRDTERKDDMARFNTALNNYQSNNNGRLPGRNTNDWQTFVINYLLNNGDKFYDPDGHRAAYGPEPDNGRAGYDIEVTTEQSHGPRTEFDHVIHVHLGATCDGESVVPSTGSRKVAFQYKLEGGGTYCGNN